MSGEIPRTPDREEEFAPVYAATSPQQPVSGRQAYNLVTDTVGGPNLRLKDNLVQAGVIFVCCLLGAGVGALVVEERIAGLLMGGFAGMVVGFFGSGLFLMFYRAVRHLRGEHD